MLSLRPLDQGKAIREGTIPSSCGLLHRPAVFDDIPITAIVTMETVGTGTRYVFTALHRDEADFEKNKPSGWQEGTEIALDQFVAHVKWMK